MDTLLTCHAKSKQSRQQCKNFVTKGKRVCWIHGGRSTGTKTIEGKQKQRDALWKHGLRSKEAIAQNREVRNLIKTCKSALGLL